MVRGALARVFSLLCLYGAVRISGISMEERNSGHISLRWLLQGRNFYRSPLTDRDAEFAGKAFERTGGKGTHGDEDDKSSA